MPKTVKYFDNQLQEFVYQRTYARYLHEEGRRETWEETVERTVDYLGKYGKGALELREYKEIKEAILNHEVYPSMRLLWSAGESAERNNISIYNCSAIPIDSINSFATVMYVLIFGTGIGFSVENQYVSQLPVIEKEKKGAGKITVVVADTKEGWAWGVKEVIERLYEGYDVDWDLSKIRPKGAILKVSGGRASGPEPLYNCLSFIKKVIVAHRGRKLSPINAADIVSKIAESVVVGGSRRSAMIALSDLEDQKMAHAKDGAFWETNMQRAMFNSSAVYTSKPTSVEFMREWLTLASSGTGERGLFNREACIKSMPARRDSNHNFLTNPCAEIMLRPYQFCNLTSVIIRENDTLDSLRRKVAIATKIGTIQATMKNFGKLSELNPAWDENAEENLLGVSLNGMADNQTVLTPENLKALKKEAKNVNEELAKRMHEKPSKSITCVKPEGSTSLVADCSSGIHPRISKFYLRRIRISGTDPLFHMMRDQGVKFVPEVGQNEDNATIWVCEFPVKSPDNALIADEVSAIDQLNQWLKLKRHWAEHTVSCTVYVNEEEWMEVGNFVYKNFDDITGVSFLPKSEHVYQLAPLEAISESDYYRLLDEQVEIDFSKLPDFEKVDMTTGAQQLACVAGQCEI